MRHESPRDRARRIRQEARGPARPSRTLAVVFVIGLVLVGLLLTFYVTGPLFGG